MMLGKVLAIALVMLLFCNPVQADVVFDAEMSAFPVQAADGTWAEYGPVPFDAEQAPEGMLEIWFGRVSVCDCFILRCNGETMMIDGGMVIHSAGTLTLLEKLGITGVNYLFNTHHHDDHIETQEYLLRKRGFNADVFLTPYERGHQVDRQQKMEKTVDSRGIPYRTIYSGDTLMLGGENGAQITFYRWLGSTNANYSSMMCKVVYGERSIYFMADVTGLAQKELALHHLDEIPWDADIFKVGHHGYARQDETLLEAISPELCVITNTKKNAELAVRQFERLGLTYVNTPSGTVYARTDGGDHWYYTQDKSYLNQ